MLKFIYRLKYRNGAIKEMTYDIDDMEVGIIEAFRKVGAKVINRKTTVNGKVVFAEEVDKEVCKVCKGSGSVEYLGNSGSSSQDCGSC